VIFRRISLLDPATGVSVEAVVNGDEQTPLVDVRAGLARLAPVPGDLFLNGRPFPAEGTLGEVPLPDGAIVGCGRPVPGLRISRASTELELRVVGGPFAGTVFPLGEGTHELGRGKVDLRLPGTDRFLGRRQLRLTVGSGTVEIEDLGSNNTTIVEGEEIREPRAIEPGTLFQAGNSLLCIQPAASPELTLVDLGAGQLGLNRKFRSGQPDLPNKVQFPTEPQESERPKLNILMMMAPAFGALVIVLITGRLIFLAFMAMGPIVGLINSTSRRRSWDRKNAKDRRQYEQDIVKARQVLRDLRLREVRQQRETALDPAATLQCARSAGRDLWSRRGSDKDLLVLRLGSTQLPSQISSSDESEKPGDLWMAPLTVDFGELGGVALTGNVPRSRALARSLVMQAATLHSPAELRVVVLCGEDAEDDWGFVRWLPHARWAADEQFVLVGSDSGSTFGRIEELRSLIKQRREEKSKRRNERPLPLILVIYDTASALLGEGAAEIMRDGPAVGVHAISIDESLIPEGCNGSVALEQVGDRSVVERAGLPRKEGVLVDGVTPAICDLAARCLAPIKVIGEKGAQELPANLRLLELLNLPVPSPEGIAQRWAAQSRQQDAAVGLSAAGPVKLDLTRDGPHGVIAGMSRSGKSEFLKTLIASLAANNHPDDLSFLFIDFKGGNDYQLAAQLPHAVDLSTQTDPAGFERALRLLDAEILRRQEIARSLKTSTLEGYWAEQAKRQEKTGILGRLVVIVDEFAELAQKQPDQLDRLVSVARVGAAYGVHLLLATQRPAGVVSGQIDANAPLRVCFRTASPEQSIDIMGTPDAAAIAERHRGRGFKRAHQQPPIEFQCARVGNARPGTGPIGPLHVSVSHFTSLGHPPPAKLAVGEVADPDTDMFDLVQAIKQAAADSGWTENAVPWPRPLPTVVKLGRLAKMSATDSRLAIPFALRDDPERQAHMPAPILLGGGHVAIAGSGATGRTTALRTAAIGVASALPCDEAHLYGLDFSGGGLSLLTKLPHCAGVASSDRELTSRMIEHLEQQVRLRREKFEQVGAANLTEYNTQVRDPESRFPWLVLLIDGWEIIHEESQTAAGAQIHDRILRLLGDGQRLGLQAVVAGDRWVAMGRAGRSFSHQFLLRFNSPGDYDALGVSSSKVPEQMPPGRALSDGRVHQIGTLSDGAGKQAAESFDKLAQRIGQRDASVERSRRPKKLASLQSQVDLKVLTDSNPPPPDALIPVLIGLSAESGDALWIDLAAEAPGFVVAGPRRKGRSTALLAMARSALTAGVSVLVVTPKKSPLAVLAGNPGVLGVLGANDIATADLAVSSTADRVLVLVDDADQIDPYHQGLTALVGQARPGLAVVIAGPTEFLKNQMSGYIPGVRRHKSGLVLCPESPYDGALIGAGNLDRATLFAAPAGRALLGLAGDTTLIQVPMTE